MVHSAHFGTIQSTLVLIGLFYQLRLIRSILSTLVLFGLRWLYSVYSVLVGPNQSILFTSVLFGQFCQFRSYSVYFRPIQSILSTLYIFGPRKFYLVHSVHFGFIRSASVLSGPFSPLQSIFGPIQSTMVIFGLFCSL